jgi:hypothetical protein
MKENCSALLTFVHLCPHFWKNFQGMGLSYAISNDQLPEEISMARLQGEWLYPVVSNDCRFGYLERWEKRQRTAAVQNLAEIPGANIRR